MATSTIVDYRSGAAMSARAPYPYWIQSEIMSAVDCDDKVGLMFSFPATIYTCSALVILNALFKVTTNMAGGTITVDVGSGTLATNGVTTDGDLTDVDKDEYIATANVTVGTAANYYATTSDMIAQSELAVIAAPMIITPANTTVPAVGVWVTSDDTITAGNGRVLLLVSEIP